MQRNWCDLCRDSPDAGEPLVKCTACPRRFHKECCAAGTKGGEPWRCKACSAGAGSTAEDKKTGKVSKERTKLVRAAHAQLRARSRLFYLAEKDRLSPFVPLDRFTKLTEMKLGGAEGVKEKEVKATRIGPKESYIHAELREYQVDGVNWILGQYERGVGGILADEMGLGKTIQTLGFLATLKANGYPGPHLVVTPLAVLQNWQNEIKRFTPGLSSIKVHGSAKERDRILEMPEVLRGDYDVYLTTYEMIMTEEAFFTETFLFHTITIDEGHRLKNDAAKLGASLARISAPFRLLLTGTPLQNNLNELWSLMQYVLPQALAGCKETFDTACCLAEGQLNKIVVSQARSLLESLMIRRVKSEVEHSLKPKLQYVLKVPLSSLQRKWYRRILDKEVTGLVDRFKMMSIMSQLQKIINHPKGIYLSLERQRKAARSFAKRAEGSEFITLPECLLEMSAEAKVLEAELSTLLGKSLVQAGGKLQVLDRLLTISLSEGSRMLIFSQWTLTLDVLVEFCETRFGPEGVGYLRLDGATNKIKREMDVRSFNAPGSKIPLYLISTKAGGMGINLATADVVVLYDSCWNPQVDLQAQDRAHRIGQKKQVKIYRLITENTLEERILSRARQKLVLDEMVIKKAGEVSALSTEVLRENDETSDEAMMAKMSLDEIWSFLHIGADKLYDPTVDLRPALTDHDVDLIIRQGEMLRIEEKGEEGDASGEGGQKGKCAIPVAMRPLETSSATFQQHSVRATQQGQSSGAPQGSGSGLPPDTVEDQDSINVVSIDRLQTALGMDMSERIVFQRSIWPFYSIGDLTLRVRGLGESKINSLKAAGIVIPNRIPGVADLQKLAAAVASAETASATSMQRLEMLEDVIGSDKRKRLAPKRFQPPSIAPNTILKKHKLSHESNCFTCGDGGDLIECQVCPKVYHATVECTGLPALPNGQAKVPKGMWYCPWHACFTCDRKSSDCGGMLFHCTSCPVTYCFDCCPDEYSAQPTGTQAHKSLADKLERKGLSTKSYLFFTCNECPAAPKPKRLKTLHTSAGCINLTIDGDSGTSSGGCGSGGGGGGSSSISAGQGRSGKSLEVWSTGSGPEGGDWKEAKRIKQGAQLEDINVVSPQRLMQVASIKMVQNIVSARTLIPFSCLKDFMKRVPSLGKSRAIIFSNAGIGWQIERCYVRVEAQESIDEIGDEEASEAVAVKSELSQIAAKIVGVVTIRKLFSRFGYYNGLITSFDANTGWFTVRYDDNDEEQMTAAELAPFLPSQYAHLAALA